MIIDTIGTSYDTFEELIERQHLIEQKVQDYIEDKELADRFESTVTIGKDDRFYLTIKIIKED